MGALTEHHRCPRGPIRRLGDALSTVALGSVIGMFVLYALDEQVRRFETLDAEDNRGVTIPGEKIDQYRRNFARAIGSVVATRVSVRATESRAPIGSARSVHTILT